jgi:Protein of unknown function (DUF3102)
MTQIADRPHGNAGAVGISSSEERDPYNPKPGYDHAPTPGGVDKAARKDTLEQISQQIKALDKKTIQNTVEIGRLLFEAEQQCSHGEYMKWLRSEFGWSHDTSLNYRKVYRLSQNPKFSDFDRLNISVSVLYLVADHIDDEALWTQTGCEAILEAAKSGRVSYRMACDIFAKHKDAAWVLPPAKPDPAIKPDEESADDDDDTTPLSFPKGRLAATVKGMLAIGEHDPTWKNIIDYIGVDQLHWIITTLKAVHDNYNRTSKASVIKAQADRAEERRARTLMRESA